MLKVPVWLMPPLPFNVSVVVPKSVSPAIARVPVPSERPMVSPARVDGSRPMSAAVRSRAAVDVLPPTITFRPVVEGCSTRFPVPLTAAPKLISSPVSVRLFALAFSVSLKATVPVPEFSTRLFWVICAGLLKVRELPVRLPLTDTGPL